MARTSHANVMPLPDAARGWNFDLFFHQPFGKGDYKELK